MSDAQQSPLAIEALISDRLQDLKLTPVELVRRCRYKNLSKGLRRLAGVRAGHFDNFVDADIEPTQLVTGLREVREIE